MIRGIGIDIVEIKRIEEILQKKESFAQRVLTANEWEKFLTLEGRRQAEYLAGRFACKEAFSKAWGTGIGKLTLQDIEVLNDSSGRPYISKSPHEAGQFVSISHTQEIAIAQVILEE